MFFFLKGGCSMSYYYKVKLLHCFAPIDNFFLFLGVSIRRAGALVRPARAG